MSRRTTIGILGWALLVLGIGLFLFAPSTDKWLMLSGAGVRVGLVMIALWLAFPQLSRVPPWIYGCTLAALLVVALRPRSILWVGPSLILLWLLRPRPDRKTR